MKFLIIINQEMLKILILIQILIFLKAKIIYHHFQRIIQFFRIILKKLLIKKHKFFIIKF